MSDPAEVWVVSYLVKGARVNRVTFNNEIGAREEYRTRKDWLDFTHSPSSVILEKTIVVTVATYSLGVEEMKDE